jgi:hypothetical protein
MRQRTGPKISSRVTRMELATSARIVGAILSERSLLLA